MFIFLSLDNVRLDLHEYPDFHHKHYMSLYWTQHDV